MKIMRKIKKNSGKLRAIERFKKENSPENHSAFANTDDWYNYRKQCKGIKRNRGLKKARQTYFRTYFSNNI